MGSVSAGHGVVVGLPGLEPGTSSLSEIDSQAPCYRPYSQAEAIRNYHRDGVNRQRCSSGLPTMVSGRGFRPCGPATRTSILWAGVGVDGAFATLVVFHGMLVPP